MERKKNKKQNRKFQTKPKQSHLSKTKIPKGSKTAEKALPSCLQGGLSCFPSWCRAGEGTARRGDIQGGMLELCDVALNCGSPFSSLVIPSVWDQHDLPSRQSPVRMRRNSFTPRASADTVKRPRHHSLGSKPLNLLGPLPSLEAREGAEQPQLEVTVQVVPSLCSPSPPSPVVLSEIQPVPRILSRVSVSAWKSSILDWIKEKNPSQKNSTNPQHKNPPVQLEFWCQSFKTKLHAGRFPSVPQGLGRGVNSG